MIVLGINCYSHDSSAAIIKNGKVLFHAEEERFNRQKHSSEFPLKAILAGLQACNMSIDEVNSVAFFFKPNLEIWGNLYHFLRYLPSSLGLLKKGGDGSDGFFARNRRQANVQAALIKFVGLPKSTPVHFVDHHLSHAASAFFGSGFTDSAIVVWDGRGETATTSFFVGQGSQVAKIQNNKVPHSLGHFYSAITSFLGFRPFHDEWKVMGLSAYGAPTYLESFSNLISFSELAVTLNLDFFSFHTEGQKQWVSDKFIARYGSPRKANDPIQQHHYDIAFALQKTLETVGLGLIQNFRKMSPSQNLCLAGGVALNILLNTKIANEGGFKNVFVMPVSADSGSAIGAAQIICARSAQLQQIERYESLDWGTSFSNETVEAILKAKSISYLKSEDISKNAARALAENKIVGWFQGRMEAGPRALGYRSILANPSSVDTKNRLNLIIKKRESFRPFAPSVLAESANFYFDLPVKDSRFMIYSGKTKLQYIEKLAAVTHVDGTARVHTVHKETNLKYWNLISEFEKLTGLPIVLNTSFNENEPIVESPQNALDCFLRTPLDALAINDFWIEKK